MISSELNFVGIPLHVTQVCTFQCQRRVLKTLIGLAKGVEFPVNENEYMLAGRILHSILQESFKFNFGHIEHYYYNQELKLQEAISAVFHQVYEKWKMLFNIQFPSALWVEDPDSVMKIDDICTKQLASLAKASMKLVLEENNKIDSLLLGEEFHISYKLTSGAVLGGRIDLFARTNTPKRYKIIELKTGKPSSSHDTQIKLYGEIFSRSYPNYEFDLELWYTKNKSDIIKSIELDETEKNLSKIDDLINNAKSVRSHTELPPPGDPNGLCRYVNSCSICNQEWKIFGSESEFSKF